MESHGEKEAVALWCDRLSCDRMDADIDIEEGTIR